MTLTSNVIELREMDIRPFLVPMSPARLGFRKAFSFKSLLKPFDLLKHLAVWQLQSSTRNRACPNGGREKSLAHNLDGTVNIT